MGVSNSGPLELGLEHTNHINSTSIPETLNAQLDNLKLEEKSGDKSDSKTAEENEEFAEKKLEYSRGEKTQGEVADVWGSGRVYERSKGLDASSDEVKVDGQDFSAPEGNREIVKYPDLSNAEKEEDGWGSDRVYEGLKGLDASSDEVKVDGWGWDQDFSEHEGNMEIVKYPDLSNEEKEEDGWGSDRVNERLKGLDASSDEVKVDGWGWDQDFSERQGNMEIVKYPDLSNEEKEEDGRGSDRVIERLKGLDASSDEVKVDGWGWDQYFSAPEGNMEIVTHPDLSNEEKKEDWGWDKDIRGTEVNVKSDTGSGNWKGYNGQRKRSPFPSRPDERDCMFYMRNGTCKFGLNCKFNHPPSKNKNTVVELTKNRSSSEMVGHTQREKAYKEQKHGALSESNVQMDCKYYSMPGGCKYGSACKYNHKEKNEVPADLNFLGLPKRPGEKECTYYMSTGSCKYSINCRFHHPDPIAVGGHVPSSGYQNGGSSQPHFPPAQMPMTTWPLQRAPNEPVPFLDTSPPYVTGYFVPPQGLHPNSEWNGYQAPVNPLFPAEINMPHPPSAPAMKAFPRKGHVSAPKKFSDGEYPERPGQPECQFFMKTGTCKFKSACKYHHPKSRLPRTPDVNVSSVGLPIRPDQPVCTQYSRHGVCKYGHSCRYNHPMDRNPSVSSASTGESTPKVFPESGVESQEVLPEGAANPVQETEW